MVILYAKLQIGSLGHAQRKDINYNEVFSPVVKHSSIQILLVLVAQYELELD